MQSILLGGVFLPDIFYFAASFPKMEWQLQWLINLPGVGLFCSEYQDTKPPAWGNMLCVLFLVLA